MPAPPHPPIQLHYENKPQYEPSPAMGYPPVQQQQQQPPPSQATGYPPVQQQNQQPSQATGYPPVYQQQQSSQAYPPMYQQQREFAAYQPPSQAQAQEPAAYAAISPTKQPGQNIQGDPSGAHEGAYPPQ
ncbi:hypothetical protein MPTK1_4g12710 [Marchantia polymorpha subsp. ruderalis]|uniref:Uncharacterized protein n=2 Tax=Marchantia polymorpha TaxID=3197 RepID=A0AAF6B999_MARPO|nr:hypothetical protein MARPO_0138s0009 [Marchantia polymorpha]BBN08583.1 hypothetical protein Mp_4g12710 [Marchantia polymorpha subsp. ruderalis]|eukprot:PTQ29569.1 hypothetical protein MARPO_0138s0009 [Marchantia polymorpha]